MRKKKLPKTKPSLATIFQISIQLNKIFCIIREVVGTVCVFILCFRYFTDTGPKMFTLTYAVPLLQGEYWQKAFPLSTEIIQTRLLHHWYIPDVSLTDCIYALHYTFQEWSCNYALAVDWQSKSWLPKVNLIYYLESKKCMTAWLSIL